MRPLVVLLTVAVFLGSVVGAGAGVMVFVADTGPSLDAPGTGHAGSAAPTDFTKLYDQTADSVVKIQTGSPATGSQGSGFLYDGSYVVTNEHVVGETEGVTVQFSDGVWRSGTVVGTDVYTDLAVIQVESVPAGTSPLPVADRLPREGQFVAAIGSPFGLQGSITHGIVSGVNRSMDVEGGFSIPDTVQTDAPVNPGNSGGPLVSMDGEVVGVNRAKSGDNVGFAISAHVVDRIVPELIRDGEADHSYVGIRSIPVTPSIADANDMERATGIAVVDVLENGPADGHLRAGSVSSEEPLSGADVIVRIDDTPVRTHEDLSRYLLLHTAPGETVTFTVVRDGARMPVDVELGERPPA